jgi:flagellar hook-associated protein 1 FlgK
MSDFSTLNLALSGLMAARRGMDVTGQNVANANTAGYTRQRLVSEAIGASTQPAVWATYDGSNGGVRVADVQRLRDAFQDVRSRDAHASQGSLGATSDALSQIESLFPEPSSDGLQSMLDSMWSGFSDVANNPSDPAARSQVIAKANTVATWLNQTSSSLDALSANNLEKLSAIATQINTAAENLAGLNTAILQGGTSGIPVNELLDQRDKLADTLAQLVGGQARVDANGTMGVYIGGAAIVRGNRAETISATTDLSGTRLTWDKDASTVTASGGTAAGLLDTVNNIIPTWKSKLDTVASQLISSVNAVHASAAGHPTYDANGNPGGAFFTGTTAANIAVLISDPSLLAASNQPPGPAGPSKDGSNADALSKLALAANGPNGTYHSLVVNLGIATADANLRATTQNNVTTQVDDARESTSGVSIDEEMTNLVTYQRAYEASGRVLTAVDQLLDTLINRTGLAGR